MKSILWVALLIVVLLGTCAWAQEPNMCVSVTDVCCDGNWSSVDYTIPAGKVIAKTYIHHDSPTHNEVDIQCLGFPNGEPGDVIWAMDNVCNCGNTSYTETIAGPQTIRFKIRCMGCNSDNCYFGSSTVYFYTISQTTCALNCPSQ